MASPSEVARVRVRFYRMVGRSVGLKIAGLLLFFALVVYLGVH